jgi:hypothetical protein
LEGWRKGFYKKQGEQSRPRWRSAAERRRGKEKKARWKLIRWRSAPLFAGNSDFISGTKDYDLEIVVDCKLVKEETRPGHFQKRDVAETAAS